MRLPRVLMVCLLFASAVHAEENPLWLRYPAISPDGRTIAFTYKGDIYSVPSAGGLAAPLTISEAHDFAPVWSHDGRSIAFASNRYGNFDVYVMPSTGGESQRLTFHSNDETPWTFTADDKAILFSAYRQDVVTSVQYPISMMDELYRVPVAGGRVVQVLPVPARNATLNSTGDKLIYHDIKGYESDWRKHHTSAVTRDIWTYDFKTGKYAQLTQFPGEDRNPVFDGNDDTFYYLSEQSGSFNVYKSSLSDPSQSTPLTRFGRHPVRFLTRARDNTLCFGYDGEIYTLRPGAEPQKVAIRIAVDGRANLEKIVPVNDGFTEMTLAPSGKEFAYVFRGEVFVSAVDGGATKRITNTPWQERSVRFSADGRSLVYAAEVDNNWNVYRTSIVRKEEPMFYLSTVLKTEPVVATPAEEYQPAFSPDGKEVAYLENRVVLKVINLASKQTRTIMVADRNYSYSDGDQYYQWSPDGKWFLVQFGYPERVFSPEVGLVSADGKGEIHNLTLSGYEDVTPKWALAGKMMIWGSSREGTRQQGGDVVSGDVYGMFFTRAAFDRFKLSKEEFALLKEQEEEKEKKKKEAEEEAKGKQGKTKAKTGEGDDAAGKMDAEGKKTPPAEVLIDWLNLTDRKAKLTVHTSPAIDWVLSKDGEKLYYLTKFEKGNDIWVTELRTKETKLFAKLGAQVASMELSADGKFIFLLADGKPQKVDTAEGKEGKTETLKVSGEMLLRPADERSYIFDHSWRQLKEKFYVVDLQGVDWDFYYAAYKRFLPFINNNDDFAEMLSEMLGEMNASHTGCRYANKQPNADQTAALGIFVDGTFAGDGLKIAEVVAGGPLDKAGSKVAAGHVIERIDGQAITAGFDFYQLLNRKAGKVTLLSLYDPATKARWDETVKPIAGNEEGALLYKRWVDNRRLEVDQLSGGKIGYVHVRSMDDASMRTMFEEALGRNVQKDAIIVDTRFNGGGNIHEQLSDFLTGKRYFDIIPHGQYVGSEPYDKWVKPSIVIMGESNYSDAHLFPVAYKLKGVGKTLGMPVPGTGTFVWWEKQIDPSLVFGIPMGGWRTPDGKFCENNQLEPDIKVRNEPDVMSGGRDQQIEAAVKELMKK
jgi:tricorn protease